MLRIGHSQSKVLIPQLATRLVESKQWQLLPSHFNTCMLKQKSTNKIFALIQQSKLFPSKFNLRSDFSDEEVPCYDQNQSSDMFMQIIKISQEYYLRQKSVMNLASKICRHQINQSKSLFSQEEILNTFTPILESMTQNIIPSFYQITSANIQVDQANNIKFKNPLEFFYRNNQNTTLDQFTLHQQMALVILQTTLMISPDNILSCMNNQQKIIDGLVQKSYSYKLIGLVLILLNEGKQVLPIDLKQWMASSFQNSWFQMLKDDLQKRAQLCSSKIEPIRKVESKMIYRQSRRYDCKQFKFEDETEDSQHQTLAKYRGGRRVYLTRIPTQDSENMQNPSRDLVQTQKKVRKQKLKLNFNLI